MPGLFSASTRGSRMKPEDFYQEMYRQHRPASAGTASRLWRRLELGREQAASRLLESGGRFLDIGCGEGSLVLLMAQQCKEAHGVDISPARIQRAGARAQKIGGGNIYFQAADVSNGLPFADGYFDAVSCIVILEHVFDPLGLLKEVRRVLKMGGQLVLVAPNIAYLPRRVGALRGKPPRTSDAAGFMDGGTLHYFTLASLTSLLKQADLVIMGKGTTGKLWFLRRWWLSLLGSSLVIKAVKS